MRSRYSAFAMGDAEYLLRTWHSSTRPTSLDLDPTIHWTGLEIIGRTGGSLLESNGTVEFRAMYRAGRRTGEQRENSRFVKQGGAWFYVGPAGT
jgi:SEC-C motif-containing protein